MTISELIERLEALKAEHGDCEVTVHSRGDGTIKDVYEAGGTVFIEDPG